MLFLHSDDGLHFKHNEIPYKMTYSLDSVQGWLLNTGKNTELRNTIIGLLQGGRSHLIEVAA